MSKMQIKTEIRVEVNDAGETIVLPFGDASFVKGYVALIEELTKLIQEDAQVAAGADTYKQYAKITEISEKLCGKIDTLIGEGTCRKVFGDIVPVPQLFSEFFEALAEAFEEYASNRRKMIESRYNKERRGVHV